MFVCVWGFHFTRSCLCGCFISSDSYRGSSTKKKSKVVFNPRGILSAASGRPWPKENTYCIEEKQAGLTQRVWSCLWAKMPSDHVLELEGVSGRAPTSTLHHPPSGRLVQESSWSLSNNGSTHPCGCSQFVKIKGKLCYSVICISVAGDFLQFLTRALHRTRPVTGSDLIWEAD